MPCTLIRSEMGANLIDRDIEGILEEAISTDPETIYVINPGRTAIRRLIEALDPLNGGPTFNLLVEEDVLKAVMEDFLISSHAADLIAEGALEMRTLTGETENALLLTDELVIALVNVDDHVGGLSTDRPSFVDQVGSAYGERWNEAEVFSLRTPPISEVHSTLEADIGGEIRSDFTAVLGSVDTARGDGSDLDEVTISLLVAAKNEALLYDISKWGEDVGMASKATFSRTKTQLEEKGLIDTEKVPIAVGRPRLRLKLGDDRLREAQIDELANVAMSAMR